MLVCDYNGWADAPEDEREALEALELGAASPPPRTSAARSTSGHLPFRWPRRWSPRPAA
jgi:hypothetical protein